MIHKTETFPVNVCMFNAQKAPAVLDYNSAQ